MGEETPLLNVLKIAIEAKTENIVLQTVCAALIAEISVMSDDPHEKFTRIVAGLQGYLSDLAQKTDQTIITTTIERIIATAEAIMPSGPK